MPDQDWNMEAGRGTDDTGSGVGALRIALLFGAGAIALAVLVAPLADRSTRALVAGSPALDTMSTGSIPGTPNSSYTIRRSVLQASPQSVCIIRSNGARSGDC